ncbi:peptidoglycan-binding domain-containing protein [Pseudohoeflea coraliihabitans]|uniref:Peptidoglycan-binding protein n=1 Tax=Pseudohoeflea coraliihabitans TaxID=2860393 RepID=A0ABS6WS78_9HYPH|nr:peptidoglycan-binding protein [Pseudohoeflea sp. DP4N28-3]MBW3098645.1 peptidoglycan-binding protein [Pseudohoeflea sp. DP4N28-3]
MTQQRASHDPSFDDEYEPGFLAGCAELIAAYPSIAGGTAAFAVIFSFVSANALWYQPGEHPAPLLRTRPVSAEAQAGGAPQDLIRQAIDRVPVRQVTTYRIERDDLLPTGSIPVPELAQRQQPEAGTDVAARAPDRAAETPAQAKPLPVADPLLVDIQTHLKRKGFYGGKVDGLIGPMSVAAIRNWQKKAGLEITGAPSALVLESLQLGGRPEPLVRRNDPPVVVPAKAPQPSTRPATPPAASPQVAAAPTQAGDELVARIQSGLSNIAYADIAVDGVAGERTRQAIQAFEKHYRLPVTGEANSAVLEKLLEIGAL